MPAKLPRLGNPAAAMDSAIQRPNALGYTELVDETVADKIERELDALTAFLHKLKLLPLIEWAPIPIFYGLGCQNSSYAGIANYSLLGGAFLLSYASKKHVLRTLADSSRQTDSVVATQKQLDQEIWLRDGNLNFATTQEDLVQNVLDGKTDLLGKMFHAVMNKYPGEVAGDLVMILKSIPTFMESLTLAYALPKVFAAWDKNGENNEHWAQTWSHLHLQALMRSWNPPTVLATLLVVGTLFQAIVYYGWLKKASVNVLYMREIAINGHDDWCVWFPWKFWNESPKRIEKTVRKEIVLQIERLHFWSQVFGAAGQGNLALVGALSGEAQAKGIAALPEKFIGMRFVAFTEDDASLMIDAPLRFGKYAHGVAKAFSRIFLSSGLRTWLNISILADTFDDLGAAGRFSLTLSICLSLFTIASSASDYVLDSVSKFYPRKKITQVVAEAVASFLVVFLIFLALAWRLVGAFLLCPESHVFQIGTMSCFNQTTSIRTHQLAPGPM